MKKMASFIITLLSVCSLSGCGASKYLEKDNGTNLQFWITQQVENSNFEGCTFLIGGYGSSIWLDSRYEATYYEHDDSRQAFAHDVCVKYTVSGYPDVLSKEQCVTAISITDPEIYVYGLSMNSTQEEINLTMEKFGFKLNENDGWVKNNCTFSFSSTLISISATVSNKSKVDF